jgi:hypothetical protein
LLLPQLPGHGVPGVFRPPAADWRVAKA